MRAESDPPDVVAEYPPGTLAERAWWARVERAAARKELIGAPGVMADWSHDMLEVLAAAENRLELVVGEGWRPIPPERCSEEYRQRETRRLNCKLGRRLGVGPMP